MAVEGTLGVFRLPEILQLIAQQGKTGILTVQGQHDIVAISFLRGDIVTADALNQAAEEGLERVLVGGGLVRREEFARAAADVQAGAGRLIDVLVERRVISREKLLEAMRLQTFRLLTQLLLWQEGDFKFYSGDEVSFEEGFAPISVQDLLIRSVEETEDKQRASRPGVPAPAATAPAPPAPGPPARPAGVPGPPAAAPQAPVSRPPPPPPMALAAPVPFRSPAAATAPRRDETPRQAATPTLRYMHVEARAPSAPPAWPAALLAVAVTALVALGAVAVPHQLVLPYPWEVGERAAVHAGQRAALLAKIDRAAKTFFLLEGRFPERLAQLESRGLLAPADLVDAEGRPLAYVTGADSYSVGSSRETIRGNFQLDPEFLSAESDEGGQPLVLLD